MTLKINGVTMRATEFAYDLCHKIYLIETPEDRERLMDYGYSEDDGTILPTSELPRAWRETCPLRFISPADVSFPDYVEQGEDAEVTWE